MRNKINMVQMVPREPVPVELVMDPKDVKIAEMELENARLELEYYRRNGHWVLGRPGPIVRQLFPVYLYEKRF